MGLGGPVHVRSEREKLVLRAGLVASLCEDAPVARDRDVERARELDDVDGGAKLGKFVDVDIAAGKLGILGAECEDSDGGSGLEDGERSELRFGGQVFDAGQRIVSWTDSSPL